MTCQTYTLHVTVHCFFLLCITLSLPTILFTVRYHWNVWLWVKNFLPLDHVTRRMTCVYTHITIHWTHFIILVDLSGHVLNMYKKKNTTKQLPLHSTLHRFTHLFVLQRNWMNRSRSENKTNLCPPLYDFSGTWWWRKNCANKIPNRQQRRLAQHEFERGEKMNFV